MNRTVLARLKPWMLPIAMLVGVVLHNYIGYVAFLSKYLIFVMLLITYCRISLHDFRLDRSMLWLLIVQIFGALLCYFIISVFNRDVAEGVFICVFCPTATAAPVITGMLGGKVEKVAVYSLLSNFVVAFSSPIIFAYMTENVGIDFGSSLALVAMSVLPLILGPLVVALILRVTVPAVHHVISNHQGLSFYIWAFSLLIVVGNCVSYILQEPSSRIPEMVCLGFLSLAVCLCQFYVGRRIGARYGDAVAGAQSLGQKNTVLGVWMAMTYLNPIASVGPACYIVWHNLVNSWQIYRHKGG